MEIYLKIDGDPVGKQRPRASGINGKIYTPRKTKEYEKKIAEEFIKSKQKKIEGKVPITVQILAEYRIPKSDSKKIKEKKIEGLEMPTKKPDIDNVIKICCDALNGLAWEDDAQIVRIHAMKVFTENPSVTIWARQNIIEQEK